MISQTPIPTDTKIVAVRIPISIYKILLEKSEDWEMSISGLLRETIINIYSENPKNELNLIRLYKKRSETNGHA
jgi:hypothetical protein